MTRTDIAIITDSTCDIPPDLIKEYALIVVPQIVIWGEQEYRDRVSLEPQEFYEKLQRETVHPTSAAATIQDFEAAYQRALQLGAKEALVLTVSAAMSGTYQNALNALENTLLRAKVVDSRGPTMSLGWQVLSAARCREAGGDLEEMIAETNMVRKTLTQIVGMDTIDYLQRGGRIGGAAKWVGSLLQVRPVVEINHTTGLVERSGLARTHSKMVELVYQKFFEKLDTRRKMHLAVLHGNTPGEAEQLAERIRREHSPVELLINITGPVLGINTGPNAIALCGYTEP